jgi:putative FmdB family regulatory protein
MPTYEYRCPNGHVFEKFQRITEKPKTKCPTCGKVAERLISGGAGLVFKGSGFYITDYGKDGKGPRKAPAETATGSETKSASKPDAGSESKSDKKPAAEPKPTGKKSPSTPSSD